MNESVPGFTPSTSESDLHRWLGYGALAAVASILLYIVHSALYLARWPEGGFGLPEMISLTGLVPLGVVLGAYYKLSHQIGAPALRHSALAWFGMLVILEMGSLSGGDVVLVPILLLWALFVVWFAVVKIRLRRVLGSLAGAVGVAELFTLVFLGLMMARQVWDTSQAIERAGGDEQAAEANVKALERTFTQLYEVSSSVLHTVWAALTAGLFLNYRRRLALAPNGAGAAGGGLPAKADVPPRQGAVVSSGETTSTREFSATGVYTASWLVGGAVLVAVSALLLIALFPYRDPGYLKYVTLLCALVLVAGLVLCATALWRGNVRVLIDPDGVTLLDVDQRQTCRWDEVAELYETRLHSIVDPFVLVADWALGKLHMLTLVDKAGRRLELKKVVLDFPALVELVKRETLTRLLPAAQAALSGGESLTFGPMTIDRHEVRVGDAQLPWAEVESFTGNGAVKVCKRGKFLTWADQPLYVVPNAHVLIALAQECVRPRDEARAVDRGQGTAEQAPNAAADGGRDPHSS
jgi:hypothetical protein